MGFLRPRLQFLCLDRTAVPRHTREARLWPGSVARSASCNSSRAAARPVASSDAGRHYRRRTLRRCRSPRVPGEANLVDLASLCRRSASRHASHSPNRLSLARRSSALFLRPMQSSAEKPARRSARARSRRVQMSPGIVFEPRRRNAARSSKSSRNWSVRGRSGLGLNRVPAAQQAGHPVLRVFHVEVKNRSEEQRHELREDQSTDH
jgi:hypothetical protein